MQTTTTISLPKNLAREIEKQVKEGNFASKSEFFRAAVKTHLRSLKGELSWEVIAAPFRAYAKEKGLTQEEVLKEVEKGRYGKAASGRK